MRKLSPSGDTETEPHISSPTSHSRASPARRHPAASVGFAETKNCCHALERPMVNVRSQTRFVAFAGQSAAKPSKSFHETRPFVEATVAAAAPFVGLMPPRIFPSKVKPVPSRFVAVLNAFVPPNQKSS